MKQNQNNLLGILYMLSGIFFLSLMDAIAKWLVEDALDPIQLVAVRSWILVVAMLGYYMISRQLEQIKPTRPVAQGVRGMCGFFATYFFFSSLKYLPLADAAVIFFSGTFMITALSWPLLKEPVGFHRWIAVTIGFIGVVIAMKPQGGGQTIGYVYCLIGSLAYALLFISGRWLSKTETVISLVFSFNLGLGVVCTLLVPLVWVPMNSQLILFVFGFAVLALLGHVCLTHAFSKAPVGVVAPFEYTGLIWTAALGYFIWKDIPANNVILGAMIIISCGLYVIYSESRNGRVPPVDNLKT